MNYTKEQTEQMVKEYLDAPTPETVNKLALRLQKSKKSVIGKLSKEGVYRRQVYKTKTGEDPETKLELVAQIADELDMFVEQLQGLDKAPKAALKNLRNKLCQ